MAAAKTPAKRPAKKAAPILPERPSAAHMEEYILAVGLPNTPVEIETGSVVTFPERFVETHLLNIRNTKLATRNRYLFYDRLLAFCRLLAPKKTPKKSAKK